MVKYSVYRAAIAAALFIGSAQAGPVGVVPGRILVKAYDDADDDAVSNAITGINGNKVDEIEGLGIQIIHVPEHALEHALQGLRHNPNIEFAEPDNILEPDGYANDPWYSSQWHLSKIQANIAWDTTTGNSTIKIAVLDTGIEGTHPDLSPQLLPGWNFYDNNSNTGDVLGHGTAVAGTAAAASNNGIGVAGVAWGCKIIPIRISDPSGYAYDSTVAKALNWAADQGARVANISYGVSDSSTVRTAAQYFQSKGGVVCVSAGNNGTFNSNPDNPYLLTVSASDSVDAVTSWSNYGNNIDLAAPGDYIYTTDTGGSYGGWSGTSFSAPVVAGTAALVLSANPNLSGVDVIDVLRQSADDLGSAGFDTKYGYGRVNANRAVSLARTYSGTPTPPPQPASDTTAPSITITSPSQGATVGNNVSVYVSTSDNVGVSRVELYGDGRLITTSYGSPFTTSWNLRKKPGAHQIQTKAYDAAGNSAVSQVVTIYR